MPSALPTVGQTVVVQFGPADIRFTRCDVERVGPDLIELRPVDPLSGEALQGDLARLVFTTGRQSHQLEVFCTEDATTWRLAVALNRRRHARSAAEFTMDLSVVGERKPVHAKLVDLSLGGARAKVPEALPVGLKTTVMIGDELGLGLPTRVVAEVIDEADHEVRMRFLEVNEATAERLRWLLGEDDVGVTVADDSSDSERR